MPGNLSVSRQQLLRTTVSDRPDFEYTGAIHIHSRFSDGSGSVADIVAAAAGTGVDFLALTDHNTVEARDEGWEGWNGNVLLLVGDEVSSRHGHCLALGTETHVEHRQSASGVLSDIRAQGGLSFIAHPHGRYRPLVRTRDHSWQDWSADDFVGLELWSYMFDWASSFHYSRFGKHYHNPDECITGPESETIELWDHLCSRRRVVAVGGVDVHARRFAPLPFVVFPYRDCFRTVRTHVLTDRALTRSDAEDIDTILQHLGAGHVFIAYDLLAEAGGTRFWAPDLDAVLGDERLYTGPTTLKLTLPIEADVTILRDGRSWQVSHGSSWEGSADGPGVYRVGARLRGRPWLYTNPIYLRSGNEQT